MNRSESIAKLAEALSSAQGAMKPADMNAVNPFLKNHYADLGSIIEAARPAMMAHGLSFVQAPSIGEFGITLETMILHSSGEWLASSMTLPVDDKKGLSSAQASGSVITYLRRYALAAMLGIYADKDEDGNEAGNGHEGAKLPEQRKATQAGAAPNCPVCHGPMWDNRGTPDKPKLNPKGPDYKCKNKECSGAIWPPKDTPAEKQEAAGRPVADDPFGELFPDDAPPASEAPATAAQIQRMGILAQKVYETKDEQENIFRPWLRENYHVDSRKALTTAQAADVIAKLEAAERAA